MKRYKAAVNEERNSDMKNVKQKKKTIARVKKKNCLKKTRNREIKYRLN